MRFGRGPLRTLVTLLITLAWTGASTAFALDVTDAQIAQLLAELPRTEQDRVFYHWCDDERGLRWSMQGRLDKGEVDFFNQATGDRQVYGAGIYLAESPTSSKSFGTFPVADEVKKGTPIYKEEVVDRVLGRKLSNAEITELGKRIPFIRNVTGDWWLTHHPDTVSHLSYAAKYGVRITDEDQTARHYRMIEAIRRNNVADGYLDSLVHLTNYYDGASLVRAIRLNPTNPWAEFEPQNFEYFRGIAQKVFGGSTEGPLGKITSGMAPKYGANADAATWARTQVEEVIPWLHSQISGRGTPSSFRGNSIRAGGTDAGRTFYADRVEYNNLKRNRYLQVSARPAPDGAGYLVSYRYPDVFGYKRLREFISPELYAELEAIPVQEMGKNKSRLEELNRRLVADLLHDLFRRYHGKSVDSVEVLRDLVSIHPFDDFNGRTARLYTAAARIRSKRSPWYFAISDHDLIMPVDRLKRILELSSAPYDDLLARAISEAMESRAQGRMARYHDLPWEKGILGPIFENTASEVPVLTNEAHDLIGKRDWTGLLRQLGLGASPAMSDEEVLEFTIWSSRGSNTGQRVSNLDALLRRVEDALSRGSHKESRSFLRTVFISRNSEVPFVIRRKLDDLLVRALGSNSFSGSDLMGFLDDDQNLAQSKAGRQFFERMIRRKDTPARFVLAAAKRTDWRSFEPLLSRIHEISLQKDHLGDIKLLLQTDMAKATADPRLFEIIERVARASASGYRGFLQKVLNEAFLTESNRLANPAGKKLIAKSLSRILGEDAYDPAHREILFKAITLFGGDPVTVMQNRMLARLKLPHAGTFEKTISTWLVSKDVARDKNRISTFFSAGESLNELGISQAFLERAFRWISPENAVELADAILTTSKYGVSGLRFQALLNLYPKLDLERRISFLKGLAAMRDFSDEEKPLVRRILLGALASDDESVREAANYMQGKRAGEYASDRRGVIDRNWAQLLIESDPGEIFQNPRFNAFRGKADGMGGAIAFYRNHLLTSAERDIFDKKLLKSANQLLELPTSLLSTDKVVEVVNLLKSLNLRDRDLVSRLAPKSRAGNMRFMLNRTELSTAIRKYLAQVGLDTADQMHGFLRMGVGEYPWETEDRFIGVLKSAEVPKEVQLEMISYMLAKHPDTRRVALEFIPRLSLDDPAVRKHLIETMREFVARGYLDPRMESITVGYRQSDVRVSQAAFHRLAATLGLNVERDFAKELVTGRVAFRYKRIRSAPASCLIEALESFGL